MISACFQIKCYPQQRAVLFYNRLSEYDTVLMGRMLFNNRVVKTSHNTIA
jgi:predicted Zn-dependent protease